ncbi:RNA polymerase I-specific transcription initiation factor rrn3 [Phytophthora palmivora]|uniref:RNA polymerase I-specific transcription initiation factor rrn3 n=1 Tax=Phytophthora palmivora TaxID=4796 RepID=A0A2P4YSA5_9STRA|nr:RNA polymerase I-specific transcription initiation factor rrn3 [Phytophthora palmivora]
MAGSASSLASPVPVAASPTEEEVASMHHFIENALDLLVKGNAKSYDFLIQQLTLVPAPVATRRKIFRALPRCISTMAREPRAYRALLDVLFKFDLLAADVEDYTSFIVHLVSSNTVYVVPTLHMLVRNMRRPQEKELPPDLRALAENEEEAKKPTKTGGISVGGSVGADEVSVPAVQEVKGPSLDERIQARFDAAHQTLERVLTLVPTAANVLFPILCEHFPHKRLDAPTQVAYLRNVLRVTGYVGVPWKLLLGLIIDQLVAIDVEIKLDESEEDVFTMDDFLDDDMLPPDDASRQVDEMADKLDQMMLVMFEHIEQSAASSSPTAVSSDTSETSCGEKDVDMRQAALIFKYLLKVFEHSVLNTHRSKYPYLLFHGLVLSLLHLFLFLFALVEQIFLVHQTPPTTRQSCGAYLASFLARAKYISVAYLQKALYHLGVSLRNGETAAEREEWLLENAEKMETTGERGFQESIFISSLQTVCYMVCFRGLEIATSDDGAGYEFLRSLGWERLLVTSTGYCPLAYCQQTVSTEFLNLVEAFDLVSEECLERVDHAIGTVSASSNKTAKSMDCLSDSRHSYKPFDPYLLRHSFRYIGPLYLYWKHADPTSSENCDLLESVKATIRQMQEDAEEDEDGSEEEDLIDEDVSMAGSAPNPIGLSNASYRADSYMGSLSRSCNMSVGSSYDGEGFADEDRAPVKRTLPSRSMFDPSPALSASSPPSRLPPLGAADAFTLGGFDDEEEEDGF